MKAQLAMAVAAMLAASQARAAEITERASPNSVAGDYAFDRVITISGELEKGDADKFRTAVSEFDHLLVELGKPVVIVPAAVAGSWIVIRILIWVYRTIASRTIVPGWAYIAVVFILQPVRHPNACMWEPPTSSVELL
jgi:hypothetical protein